jgi:hypothetical protein
VNNFDKKFITNTYRDLREQILIEREMGMLQATQPYVEKEIKIEELSKEMNVIKIESEELISKLRSEINKIRSDSNDKMALVYDKISDLKGNVEVERKKFIRKCPNGECHGFLSTALKCALCKIFACADCHEVKGTNTEEREAHVCDQTVVESVKAIAKDSKPCPNCACITFKINGCDQMFCTECHMSWNWKTGRLVTSGPLHNPHYIAYMAQQNNGVAPRDPNDIICGQEIDNHFIIQIKRKFHDKTLREFFMEIARNVLHIRSVELGRFRVEDGLQDNLKMRISYMRGHINKESFKKTIQKKDKENQKKREITNVLTMYVNCMTDLFYRLINNPENIEVISEMENLRTYTNNCFQEVSTIYNCKKYTIAEDSFNYL